MYYFYNQNQATQTRLYNNRRCAGIHWDEAVQVQGEDYDMLENSCIIPLNVVMTEKIVEPRSRISYSLVHFSGVPPRSLLIKAQVL